MYILLFLITYLYEGARKQDGPHCKLEGLGQYYRHRENSTI